MIAVTNASIPQAGVTAETGQPGNTTERWVRVGRSREPTAHTAGAAATRQALRGPDPKLLMVFASLGYDLTDLIESISETAGSVPIIGCSTFGEIGPSPVLGGSVVVVCLGGGFAVTTAHATGLDATPRLAGQAVASRLLPLPEAERRLVILLTDATTGDQQEMIRGAYGVLGAAVPILGGGTGNTGSITSCRQFYNRHILQDAVVAAAIGTAGAVGLSVSHGWRHDADAMLVTESAGREIFSLDDRPALDRYLERHQIQRGAGLKEGVAE
ncbi:MAG: hypothetical protein JXA67_02075, partial [Micromonosporaceae bacterium]|nr:hypothetical protein [Micromonosporaceae bacterium]